MQGTIAQLLGLAIHANAFLQGRDIGPFWPGSSIFTFCRSVRFVTAGPDGAEVEVAADPVAWLTGLRSGCRGVRAGALGRVDMMQMSFVDGSQGWQMAEIGGERPLRWRHEWQASRLEADSDRPWSVIYYGAETGDGAYPPGSDLEAIERNLEGALRSIAGFAEHIGSGHSESFRRALGCLGGDGSGRPPFYSDLAPPDFLSPRARRLLAASQTAWVFGGMGAWNDEDHGDEGNRLTDTLFASLQTALAAVVDSTLPPASDAARRPSPTSPSDR